MNFSAIQYRPSREFIIPTERNQLSIRLQTTANDVISCEILYWKRNLSFPESMQSQSLTRTYHTYYADDFRGTLSFQEPAHYIKYCFRMISSSNETFYLTENGFSMTLPETGFFEFLYANENDIFRIPDWAKGVIYYQIFPDRFAKSSNAIYQQPIVDWSSQPEYDNYFGGTLQGMIDHFDYFKNLGVECLYLTPIFEAKFNHKYATINYYAIDPNFGTIDDLRKLVQLAHTNHIRVILDGVFNHVGRDFAPFRNLLQNNETSPYRDWFFCHSFPLHENPLNYECVGDYSEMPKLRTANPEIRAMIIDVMQFWIREANIDGWRLDVADEIDFTTLQSIRMELKRQYPDALLLGECWGDAFRLVGNGDQMDCAMNYLFRNVLIDWIAKKKILPSALNHRIHSMLSHYWDHVNMAMYNLLGSHDTPRFLFESGGNWKRSKLAAIFQFTFLGAPAIYYGDEIGMTGDNDPDCRRGMVWESQNQNQELLSTYQNLIDIRKKSKALKRGTFRTILCDDQRNLYGFERQFENETVQVFFNNDEQDHIIHLCPTETWEQIQIPAVSAKIISKEENYEEKL